MVVKGAKAKLKEGMTMTQDEAVRTLYQDYKKKEAAHELYDALQDIIADFDDLERGEVTTASINKARRAVAKAEGR